MAQIRHRLRSTGAALAIAGALFAHPLAAQDAPATYRDIEATRERVARIMTRAKASDRLLTDEELHALARLD